MEGMNSHMGFETCIIPKRVQLIQGLLVNGMLSSCQKKVSFFKKLSACLETTGIH